MVTRPFVMLAALAACGGPTQQKVPVDNPVPPGAPAQVTDAAVATVTPDAAPPAAKPWSRESLPKWEPVTQGLKAAATEPITVWAVNTSGDWLLREVAAMPAINYVFASTGKRLTGQLYAPAKFDAFATVAAQLGIKVEPIKAKGKGAWIDFDFVGAPFADLVRIIADVGRINVVVAPGAIPDLNVRLKGIPWDQALAVFIDRVGWTFTREGNAFFIVPKGTTLAPTPKLPGATMDVDTKDATVAQIVTGIRALGQLVLGSCSATKVSVRFKRAAPGTIVKGLEIVSGEKLGDKAECPSKPLGDEPLADLELVAIVAQGIKRIAVFDHKGATVIGTRDGKRIKDIGTSYVTFATDGTEVSLQVRPFAPDAKPDAVVKSFTRTSALIQRGHAWLGILETPTGSRTADSKSPPVDGITYQVSDDGVRVMRDGTEVRMLPLSP
jgi:hypothetical protein